MNPFNNGLIRHISLTALALVAVPLASCSGNNTSNAGSSPMPPAAPQLASTAVNTTAPVTISIGPSTLSNDRIPMYISPSTASISVSVSAPGAATASSTANCTTTCTVTVMAPIGNDTFTVSLFDGANGGGHALSVGTTPQAIALGSANTVNIGLKGVVASVALNILQPITVGQASSQALSIVAKDAGGNVITGGFSQPLSLAITDASGSVSLSASSVTQSTDTITVAYSGSTSFTGASVAATAPGVAQASSATAPIVTPTSVPITIHLQ